MMMTKQEVFTKIVTGLRTQGRKSESSSGDCLYRGPDGTKCAAGMVIEDEHYDRGLELRSIIEYTGKVKKALNASGVPDDALAMVDELQTVHDCRDVAEWEGRWAKVASRHGVSVPEAT